MAMSRPTTLTKLVRQFSHLGIVLAETPSYRYNYCAKTQPQFFDGNNALSKDFEVKLEHQNEAVPPYSSKDAGEVRRHQIGPTGTVSRKDNISFLVRTLLDSKDSKEDVYGALDAWVAWKQNFPIGPLKHAVITLEKDQQWRKIIQVIKWMLSKGQGKTMNTYGQLIRALDMDNRVTEAHDFWVKKIGSDLHSVPWNLCNDMISAYYRNNMLEHLVKLFKGLEAFDRKPSKKSMIHQVANAYELLGLPEEKERVLKKYKDLLEDTRRGHPAKATGTRSKKKEKPEQSQIGNSSKGVKQTVVDALME